MTFCGFRCAETHKILHKIVYFTCNTVHITLNVKYYLHTKCTIMPPIQGKKVTTQPPLEPTPEPIQTTAIVIIHPGSSSLRLGRAADAYPYTLPHCIARRHKVPGSQVRFEDPWISRKETDHTECSKQRKLGLRAAQEAIQYRPTSQGVYRDATNTKQLHEVNSCVDIETSEVKSPIQWTNTSYKPDVVVGQDALFIEDSDSYNLHWPIQRGQLNLHPGPGGTLTAVLQDLHDIWSYAIQNFLDIPVKDLKHYRAALLIPDVYNRVHAREMLNLLLQKLGFAAAFLVQDTVCATFGAGVSSACVVDIGDQKTSVCCVEDGLSQKNTRILMEYGGSDITRTLHWLLCRTGFPYKDCNISNRMDGKLLQELKHSYCHMDHNIQGFKECHIQIKHPSSNIRKFTMQMGDERILAPMSIFHPDIYGLQGKNLSKIPEKYQSDPTDPKDEDYIAQTMSKHEQAARAIAQKKKAEAESTQTGTGIGPNGETLDVEAPMDEEDTIEPSESFNTSAPASSEPPKPVLEDMSVVAKKGLVGLDQAILQSIDKCESDDMKKRMYSCILVVGGGLKFPMAQSWLQYLVWTQMPGAFRLQLETQDILTSAKDLDPQILCWKGCSVLCCLDTAQELWIRQREWKRYGVKVLRERAPFVWVD